LRFVGRMIGSRATIGIVCSCRRRVFVYRVAGEGALDLCIEESAVCGFGDCLLGTSGRGICDTRSFGIAGTTRGLSGFGAGAGGVCCRCRIGPLIMQSFGLGRLDWIWSNPYAYDSVVADAPSGSVGAGGRFVWSAGRITYAFTDSTLYRSVSESVVVFTAN